MMKCKECRDFKQCLYEANRLEQIFDPEYEFADCFAPISNAGHIRSMSDEELLEFLFNKVSSDDICEFCVPTLRISTKCDGHCRNGILKWLKQPYKEKEE